MDAAWNLDNMVATPWTDVFQANAEASDKSPDSERPKPRPRV